MLVVVCCLLFVVCCLLFLLRKNKRKDNEEIPNKRKDNEEIPNKRKDNEEIPNKTRRDTKIVSYAKKKIKASHTSREAFTPYKRKLRFVRGERNHGKALSVRIVIYDIIINRIFKKKESKTFFLFFYKNIYGTTLVSCSHSSIK